jgi:hypothetical protein
MPLLKMSLPRAATTMWWLSFSDGGVVIINAVSLTHARLLAAANGLGRASHFVEGNLIDTERLPPIPQEFVGRILSPIDARQLLEILNRSSDRSRPAR